MVDKWDISGDGRVLYADETGTPETGAVAAIYSHVNNNVKISIGYAWGSVSDEETNLSYESQGLLLNLVGKF